MTAAPVPLSTHVDDAVWRALVEHAPDAIVLVDLDSGRLVEVNHSAVALFGRAREELLGMDMAALSPPRQPDGIDSLESTARHVEEVLAGRTAPFEWSFVDSHGTEVSCEVRYALLPVPQRRLLRIGILCID